MRTAKSEFCNMPASTLWHRANGRPSKEDKAANQQYPTTLEENALATDILRVAKNDHLSPVRFLPLLAVIFRQRQSPSHDDTSSRPAKQPSPNWVRGFLRRHPEVRARRSKPIDLKRHDYNICDKAEEWFSLIESELHDPVINPANVYIMDETRLMLSSPSSNSPLRALVGREYGGSRGARVKLEVVTAIACISADGRAFHATIIHPS